MSEEPEIGENLNSALNLWQEAVDKAGVDLEKIVNNSVEQLARYSEELEKSLTTQLAKIGEQASMIVENNIEELTARKDELQEEIAEFERRELDKIILSAQAGRAEIGAMLEKAKQDVMNRFESAASELTHLSDNPKVKFAPMLQSNREALAELALSATDTISDQQTTCQHGLTDKVKDIENQLETVVSESKALIERKLEGHGEGFDDKISQVLSQLDSIQSETTGASAAETGTHIKRLNDCVKENRDFLEKQVNSWKSNIDAVKASFEEQLESTKEEAIATQKRRLHYTASEAKGAIGQIAADAQARITGNHKMYYGSLKRLERKYEEQVAKLLNRLEAVIAEEREIPASLAMSSQSVEETRQKLRSQLKVRGGEVVKTYRRQIEQVEGDFARASASSYERIDSIRLQTVESLEKQVRIIRSELERINKLVKAELSQVAIELPEIEERGRVAAMSVQAFQSSMLTLEGDD